MEKIKRIIKQEYIYIILSILIGFMFYGIYAIPHVSNDGYWWMEKASEVKDWQFLYQNGRFSYDILMGIFNKLNIYPVYHQTIFMSISIGTMSLVAFSTYYIIKTSCIELNKKLEVVLFLGVISIYFNTFFTDWFEWSECVMFIHLPGLVCALMSAYFLNKNKRGYNYIISAILLIIGFGFYQTVGFYFFLIHTVYIVKEYIEGSNLKKSFINIIKSFVVFVIASLSQIALTTLLHIDRANYGNTDIVGNVINIIHSLPILVVHNLNTMPAYMYIVLFLIAILFAGVILKKNKGLSILVLILFAGLVSILFITHVIGNEFWLVARSTTGLMALPGWIIAMGIMSYSAEKENDTPITVFIMLIVTLCIFIFTSFYQTQKLAVGIQITNHIDRESVIFFEQKIRQHEKDTGVEVKNIGFIRDESYTYSYDGILAHGDTNMRGYTVPWNRLNMFNYYSGRKLAEVEVPNEVYEVYFKGKDWTVLSDEQIIILDDIAYICIY